MRANSPQTLNLPASGIGAVESRHGDSFEMQVQTHAFHEVFLLVNGIARVHISDGDPLERVMRPGTSLAVPAGVPHRIVDDRASTLIVVAFSDAALDNGAGRRAAWDAITDGAPPSYRVLSPRAGLSGDAWRGLLSMTTAAADPSSHANPLYRIELENAFNRFLIDLARAPAHHQPMSAHERVMAFQEDLAARCYEDWSLDRAAAETHLSRRRFSQVWRDVSGDTFISGLQELRVKRTQHLILREKLSILAAAYAAGFNDVANFYRVFRRCVGTSPGAWLAAETATRA